MKEFIPNNLPISKDVETKAILKKFNIDPAIGSTVVLTTVTDMMGFFSFLGLAKLLLVQ